MENAIIHAEVLGTNRGKEYYCHCSFGFPPIGLSWWKRGKIHASAAMHHPRTRTGDNFTRKVERVERGWVGASACPREIRGAVTTVSFGNRIGRLGIYYPSTRGRGSHYGNKLEGTSCVSAMIFMYVASLRRRWLERRTEEEEEETSYDSLVRGFWLIDDAKL